jgi:hypothetical protein
MHDKLLLPSHELCSQLYADVGVNLPRYRSEGFEDHAGDASWCELTSFTYDPKALASLAENATPEKDAEAAIIVWRALSNISPSVAREGRIWTRICHVEGLSYARSRWIRGSSDQKMTQEIQAHFFSRTWTRIRDDNAIARLWWTAWLAKQACPENFEEATRALLKTKDIRNNIIERAWTASRHKLVRGIIRAIISEPFLTASDRNFREFMKNLNVRGGGVLFELLDDSALTSELAPCIPTVRLTRPKNTNVAKKRKKRRRKK